MIGRRPFLFLACAGVSSLAKEGYGQQGRAAVEFHIDWKPGGDYAGFYVASERGLYRDRALDVKIIPGSGAEDAVQLLATGRVRLGTTTADAILNYGRHLSSRSIPISKIPKIAGIFFKKNPVVIVSRSDLSIANLSSLQGKVLGFTEEGSVTIRQFEALWHEQMHSYPLRGKLGELDRKNLNADNITIVQVGYGGEAQYLKAGDIDAVLAYATDVPVDLAAQRFDYRMRYLADLGVDVPGMVVAVAPGSKIDGKVVGAFLQASVKGWEEARANPGRAADLMLARFPEFDRFRLEESIRAAVALLPPGGTAEEYLGRAQIEVAVRTSDAVVQRQLSDPRQLDPAALCFDAT